jgi:hypothetical protein
MNNDDLLIDSLHTKYFNFFYLTSVTSVKDKLKLITWSCNVLLAQNDDVFVICLNNISEIPERFSVKFVHTKNSQTCNSGS